LKIAICTPCYGDVTAQFAYSLAKLVQRTVTTQLSFNEQTVFPTVELFMRSSSVLPQLRNMLVKDAIVWGANYLLWLDSDQSFPDEALLRLLSLNLPAVGVNYPRRVPPHSPTAVGLDGKLVYTTEGAARANEIVPVQSMGFGCCLISMPILDQLQQRAVETGRSSIWPLFAVEMVGDGSEIVGEDVFFFRLLQDAGIPVHLDQALSWSIGHVHQRVAMNSDVAPNETVDSASASRISF
jgi:hypothetical protein